MSVQSTNRISSEPTTPSTGSVPRPLASGESFSLKILTPCQLADPVLSRYPAQEASAGSSQSEDSSWAWESPHGGVIWTGCSLRCRVNYEAFNSPPVSTLFCLDSSPLLSGNPQMRHYQEFAQCDNRNLTIFQTSPLNTQQRKWRPSVKKSPSLGHTVSQSQS